MRVHAPPRGLPRPLVTRAVRRRYVLAIADLQGDGEVELKDTMLAVATWSALLSDQQQIDASFDRYDSDHSGTLDPAQVGSLLKDLNGGKAVSDADIAWVISQADGKSGGTKDGVLQRQEVEVAVAVWYTKVEQTKRKSSACSIL